MELVRFDKDKHDIVDVAHLMASTDFETITHYFPNESYVKVFSFLALNGIFDNEECYVFEDRMNTKEGNDSKNHNIYNTKIRALAYIETKKSKISRDNIFKLFSIFKTVGIINAVKFIYINYKYSRILAEIEEGDIYLAELSVSRNQRGNGIGPIMLNKIIDLARKRGFKRLTLDVESNNSHANYVYEKFGFKTFGKDSIKWNGKKKEMYHMEYIL